MLHALLLFLQVLVAHGQPPFRPKALPLPPLPPLQLLPLPPLPALALLPALPLPALAAVPLPPL